MGSRPDLNGLEKSTHRIRGAVAVVGGCVDEDGPFFLVGKREELQGVLEGLHSSSLGERLRGGRGGGGVHWNWSQGGNRGHRNRNGDGWRRRRGRCHGRSRGRRSRGWWGSGEKGEQRGADVGVGRCCIPKDREEFIANLLEGEAMVEKEGFEGGTGEAQGRCQRDDGEQGHRVGPSQVGDAEAAEEKRYERNLGSLEGILKRGSGRRRGKCRGDGEARGGCEEGGRTGQRKSAREVRRGKGGGEGRPKRRSG